MSSAKSPFSRKDPLVSRLGYSAPAIQLIAGALILMISIGFFFLPSLNRLWFGLSILLFVGLAGSGFVQIFQANRTSRRSGDLGGSQYEVEDPYLETLSLSDEASHDKLLEHPNRALLEDRMARDKGRADRSGTGFAVFCISLDNYHQISNQQGLETSEKVLLAVAKTLVGSLRPTDTVARWKEDELIVLIPDLLTMDAAQKVSDKLFKSTRRFFSGTSAENITFSIGVAVYPNDADTIRKLCTKAERALQLAKSLGHNNIQFASEPSGPMIW